MNRWSINQEGKKRQSLIFLFAVSLLLNVIIELLSRKSISNVMSYIIANPIVFLYNAAIIFFTLSLIYLSRRRVVLLFIISCAWIAIGLTNGILLSCRTTPFTATDLKLVKYAARIFNNYMSITSIIFLIIGVIAVISLITLLWKKAPVYRGKVQYIKGAALCIITFGIVISCTEVGMATNVLARNFGNIADAYQTYGLPYCFANSLVNTGIKKPSGYEQSAVETIIQKDVVEETAVSDGSDAQDGDISSDSTATVLDKPNIIMVQLESFFDITAMKNLTFSADPIPTFRSLLNNYSSGYLNVPSVGAGTANTEFEVITGMNLDFFGPGEYPYKTILKSTTCESIPYNLSSLGYVAHAIHNNEGTFYGRNDVFSQLGFNTFTSVEYMDNLQYNEIGWAKDDVLVEEIVDTLNSTKQSDFIYAISVQGHGKYPEEDVLKDKQITVTGLETEALENQYNYYVNQIYEMDQFVNHLITTLAGMDEKYVVVFYGDHLPSLGIEEEDLSNGNLYQTQYVIWNNFGLEKADCDIESYQLSAAVLNSLDIHKGYLTRYHQSQLFQNQRDEETYLADMKIMEYDMLYGDQTVYGGVNPYAATNLQMGIKPIHVTKVSVDGDNGYVFGGDFTKYSKVFVNGKQVDTEFMSNMALAIKSKDIKSGDVVTVGQVGDDKVTLSYTDKYIVQ